MTNQRVADRYAKSLLDLAVEQDQLDVIKGDVDNLVAMAGNRDLELLLESPVVKPSKKNAILAELLDKSGAAQLTKLFVKILIDKGREGDLIGILGAFKRQYKQLKAISTVKVTSATELTEASLAAITRGLIDSGKTETNVDIETEVDPALIGGFVLEFGGRVYDASVKHKLAEIRKTLVE